MSWTSNNIFMVGILTINLIVWLILAIPKNRAKLPKIYFIARSWLWMLSSLFLCFYISGHTTYNNDDTGHRPYWWVIHLLLVIIGLRGLYEISRLWRSKSKLKFIEKLEQLNVQIKTKVVDMISTGTTPANANNDRNPNSIEASHSSSQLKQPELNRSKRLSNWWERSSWLDIGLFIAFIYLIFSLMVLAHLSIERGQQGVFLFVIFASQFNDIAQYLCGRFLGGKLFSRKLAPTISPNKTIEGALFGSLLSASLATALGVWLTSLPLMICFAMAYFLAVSGIMGDLFESAFKRRHGIKDTGTMLAGHGGILDRVDSLLIGVPIITLVYWLFL